MALANPDLWNRTLTAVGHHLFALGRVAINANFFNCGHALAGQQPFGLHAKGAYRCCIKGYLNHSVGLLYQRQALVLPLADTAAKALYIKTFAAQQAADTAGVLAKLINHYDDFAAMAF